MLILLKDGCSYMALSRRWGPAGETSGRSRPGFLVALNGHKHMNNNNCGDHDNDKNPDNKPFIIELATLIGVVLRAIMRIAMMIIIKEA